MSKDNTKAAWIGAAAMIAGIVIAGLFRRNQSFASKNEFAIKWAFLPKTVGLLMSFHHRKQAFGQYY